MSTMGCLIPEMHAVSEGKNLHLCSAKAKHVCRRLSGLVKLPLVCPYVHILSSFRACTPGLGDFWGLCRSAVLQPPESLARFSYSVQRADGPCLAKIVFHPNGTQG